MPPSSTATSPTLPAHTCKSSVPVSAISRMMFFLWFSSRVLSVIHIFVYFHFSFSSAIFSCLVSLLVCTLTWYGTTPSESATCRTDPYKYFSFDELFCAQGVYPGLRAGKSLYCCLDVLLFCDSVPCLGIFFSFTGIYPDSRSGRSGHHHSV